MAAFDEGLADRLAAAIGQLADGCRTEAEVAARLYAAGCRGQRGGGGHVPCPVCPWLARRITLPGGQVFAVGIDITEILTRGVCELEAVATAGTPPVVAAFLEAFDTDERFPELLPGAPADGESFEVYAAGAGIGAYDARPFGVLGHDEAHEIAREASVSGRDHVVERITVRDGLARRTRIAEFSGGQPVALPQPHKFYVM